MSDLAARLKRLQFQRETLDLELSTLSCWVLKTPEGTYLSLRGAWEGDVRFARRFHSRTAALAFFGPPSKRRSDLVRVTPSRVWGKPCAWDGNSDESLETLELSVRVSNQLKRLGIKTIRQFIDTKKKWLLSKKSLEELEEAIAISRQQSWWTR